MSTHYSYFAPCARGAEPLLADELRRLGLHGVRPQRSGVLFTGDLAHGYRALLWSRLASRVLLSLGDVEATNADSLYAGVLAISWEDHVRADGTIAVDAAGSNEQLRNTQFIAVRVKDAIADRLRTRFGSRPSVDTRTPDVRINVVVRGDKGRISIDLSGEPLHRRGYREPGSQVVAPIKETLAAAVLEVAGWREIAKEGGAFIDPLCGSGTLAIEAALLAADAAPGLTRAWWGFERWLGHDPQVWAEIVERARDRRERGMSRLGPVWASDSDPRAVKLALGCVRRAGLEGRVEVACEPLAEVRRIPGASTGLVATNPPYGERLSERAALPALYAQMASRLGDEFEGWTLAIISSDTNVARGLKMHPVRVFALHNGAIPAPVSVFVLEAGAAAPVATAALEAGRSGQRADGEQAATEVAAHDPPDAAAQAFENRLRKMARHLGSWARRAQVSCYRVYDADLPDYNLAIDLYTDEFGTRHAHVAEYAAPAGVDPTRAAQRIEWAVHAVAEVLAVEPPSVTVKRRERQRGRAQYERQGAQGVIATVKENGLRFEVNMSDYLDTGLFLDHRDTRAMLREVARGARFLNLFAYTGTASVYAAAGGAASTTTVDLSQTYLDWAKRNFALNGAGGIQHRFERAESFDFLRTARDSGSRYDLIFVDPPTFSNSKRVGGTFDVQRDHVALLIACGKVLEPGGTIVFSCNRRKFALDTATLASEGFSAVDITAQTLPKDFERSPSVHSCWRITRG